MNRVESEITHEVIIRILPFSRYTSKDRSVRLLALRQKTFWSVVRERYPAIPEQPPKGGKMVSEVFLDGDDLVVGEGTIQDHGWFKAMGLKNKGVEQHKVVIPRQAIASFYLETQTTFL